MKQKVFKYGFILDDVFIKFNEVSGTFVFEQVYPSTCGSCESLVLYRATLFLRILI